MSMALSIEGDDPVGGLEQLSDWLGHESELRGMITAVSMGPAPGELGVPADALVAAVSSGGALSVLIASLKAFLTLPRRSDLRIVLSMPDGRKVKIDAKRVGDAEALIREAIGRTE
jgi:Effector Associated Constant Component 1